MRRILLAATLTTICGVVLAQDSKQLDKCLDKADTQLAMNVCADQEVRRVDAELNGIYQELLSAARDESGAVDKIRAVERAWIVYRDAYLEAMYPAEDKQAAYGFIYAMNYLLLRGKIEQQQTDALRELLKHYEGIQ